MTVVNNKFSTGTVERSKNRSPPKKRQTTTSTPAVDSRLPSAWFAFVMLSIRIPQDKALVNQQLQLTLQKEEFHQCVVLCLQVTREGVCWRGLHPLLFEAPPQVARRAVRILLQRFQASVRRDYRTVADENEFLAVRQISFEKSVHLVIVPPLVTNVLYTFSGILIRYEHLWLTLQSLSAWIATLGGGYFLCRHLATAVHMARQQRALALWMGDHDTADRCTLNEAFNYIHAGMFRLARRMIHNVRQSSTQRNDTLTLRMVHSARLFLDRVQRAAKFAREKDDTIDDYQRIRIVSDRSRRVNKIDNGAATSTVAPRN